MSSPYGVKVRFYLENTETLIFHELERLGNTLREGDTVYLNDTGYKVESVKLYIYDSEVVNENSGATAWFVSEVFYKIYISLLVV